MVPTTNELGPERCVRHNAHVSAWKVFRAREVAKDLADLASSMKQSGVGNRSDDGGASVRAKRR